LSRLALFLSAFGFFVTACLGAGPPTDPSSVHCGGAEVTIEIITADDVRLVADLWPADSSDRGAVILLHMKPPDNDREDYPEHVREAMADLDLTVINVDRRGAGSSEGDPDDAYEGPGGLLDVEAAVAVLADPSFGCPVDLEQLALVGASNGTTAALDYTVEHEPGLPTPSALVWLSPGPYTENQNGVDEHRELLETLPILWIYPEAEGWADDFIAGAPETWQFIEWGEEHGTDMFDGGALETVVVRDILAWLDGSAR